MKKLLIALLGLMSATAYAAPDGFYMGLQAGYGDNGFSESQAIIPTNGMSTDFSKTSTTNFMLQVPFLNNTYYSLQPLTSYKSSTKSSNLAGRLFLGYKFNSFIAGELGYTQFADSTLTINAAQTFLNSATNTNVTLNRELISQIQERMVDLTAKFIYEVQNPGLSFYGKLGAALTNVSQQAKIIDSATILNNTTGIFTTTSQTSALLNVTTHPIRPLVGAGIDFDITDNAEMDVEATYIIGNSFLPDSKFGSLNFVYHFA